MKRYQLLFSLCLVVLAASLAGKSYVDCVYEKDGRMIMKLRKVYGDRRIDGGDFSGTWTLNSDGIFTTYNSRINNDNPLGVRRIYFADGVYYEVDINSGTVRYRFVRF